MGGRIFIEADEARFVGLPTGAQHLYLVHRDTDGEEYVIRSGPSRSFWFGAEMEVEANVPIDDSADDRGGESLNDRHSTELTFQGGVDKAWAIIVKYARMIQAEDYDYELLDANSNAFIAAMVAAAGRDPDASLSDGVSRREAVGYGSYDEILGDIEPPADGTVYGTARGEAIAGIQIGEAIRALGGNDTVRAGRGDDRVFGGSGADRLFGEAGNDRLSGGSGADLLLGGTGRNTLIGGSGPDTFLFAGPARDRIEDFQDGMDRIRIESTTVENFGDLTVARFGAAGQHTRIAFDSSVIELRDFDRDRLDAGDFVFTDPGLV